MTLKILSFPRNQVCFMFGWLQSCFFPSELNPSGLGTQPQVQVSPQNIEVHEGDTLRLYCRATGSPTPKLTWLKNGGQIPPQVRHTWASHSSMDLWVLLELHLTHRGVTMMVLPHNCHSGDFDLLSPFCLSPPPLLFYFLLFLFSIQHCCDVFFASGHSLSRFSSV